MAYVFVLSIAATSLILYGVGASVFSLRKETILSAFLQSLECIGNFVLVFLCNLVLTVIATAILPGLRSFSALNNAYLILAICSAFQAITFQFWKCVAKR